MTTKLCVRCGLSFEVFPSWTPRRYCSRKCRFPTNTPSFTTDELAWMAGVFESEGSLGISKKTANGRTRKSPHYLLEVNVANTDIGIIQSFPKFGGTILLEKRSSPLSVKPVYRWTVRANLASNFLESVLPYLRSIKGRRARFGIEFQKQKVGGGRVTSEYNAKQEQYYNEMKLIR